MFVNGSSTNYWRPSYQTYLVICTAAVADQGEGGKGAIPPGCKNSHKKMAALRSGLYFMFPPPPEVSTSAV